MILIRHVVDTFNRFDTWNTYTEIDLRRKMGIGPDNAGCSIKQADQIIDALFPGSAQQTFRGQVKSYLAKISKIGPTERPLSERPLPILPVA